MDQNQATNQTIDNDLQKAIDDITNTTNVDPVFSDPVAAPSSVPEGGVLQQESFHEQVQAQVEPVFGKDRRPGPDFGVDRARFRDGKARRDDERRPVFRGQGNSGKRVSGQHAAVQGVFR